MTDRPPTVLVIIADLLFRSKIDDAARQANVALRVAKGPEQLERHLRTGTPEVVLIDLEMTGIDRSAMLETIRSAPDGATVPVIGFAGHTNVEVIRAARAEGVQVMARSAFVEHLPVLMERIAHSDGR